MHEPSILKLVEDNYHDKKQAGVELCQAQEKLGIAYSALPSKKLWSSSICQPIKFILHLLTNGSILPFANKLMSSYIFQQIEVVLHLPTNWGCLTFTKILASSSICQKNEVVFHLKFV